MENQVEMEEPLVEFEKKQGETKKKEGSNWRNLKIRRSTYEQIKRLSELLGVRRYKVVDLSILIFSVLLSEKIVMSQEESYRLGLDECKVRYGYNEGRDYAWIELDPICILKKIIMPHYKRSKAIEALIRNIEELSKI